MFDGPDALSAWLKSAAAEFEARIDELDGLDAAIGDGDHGTNMARGMATAATITPGPDTTTRQYLNQVGMALVSSVDGADDRSEERRVGKECRSRWSPYH